MQSSRIKIKCRGSGCGRIFSDTSGLARHAKHCESARRDFERAMLRARENENRPAKRRKLGQVMQDAEESGDKLTQKRRQNQQHAQHAAANGSRSNERSAQVSSCSLLFHSHDCDLQQLYISMERSLQMMMVGCRCTLIQNIPPTTTHNTLRFSRAQHRRRTLNLPDPYVNGDSLAVSLMRLQIFPTKTKWSCARPFRPLRSPSKSLYVSSRLTRIGSGCGRCSNAWNRGRDVSPRTHDVEMLRNRKRPKETHQIDWDPSRMSQPTVSFSGSIRVPIPCRSSN